MHGALLRTSSTAQNLASLFRSAARLTFRRTKTSAARRKKASVSGHSSSSPASAKKKTSVSSLSPEDAELKKYVSSVKSSSLSAAAAAHERANREKASRLLKDFKAPPSSKAPAPPNSSLNSIVCGSLTSDCTIDEDESAEQLASNASSILYDEMDLNWDDEFEDLQDKTVVSPWLDRMTSHMISARRKEVSQDTKQKWVFTHSFSSRYNSLINMFATKMGSDVAVLLFGKLGRENGLKELSALIKICIDKARETSDENESLQQIYIAYQILKLAKESGFEIEEETYGHFLMYLIDFRMSEEFFFFHELIREDNPDSLPCLSYYEMLLLTRVSDENEIQELCRSVAMEDDERFYRREGLLLVLFDSDRKKELLMLLKTFDISKVTSVAVLERIFRGLGKFLLEPFAERFLPVLKGSDIEAENISNLILEYAISIPNLAVRNFS